MIGIYNLIVSHMTVFSCLYMGDHDDPWIVLFFSLLIIFFFGNTVVIVLIQ